LAQSVVTGHDVSSSVASMRTQHQSPRAANASSAQANPDPRHALGRLGEDLAAAHLTRLGFSVLARNVRTRHGEIDLIAFDGHTLAIVEVKTRRGSVRRPHVSPDQEPLAWLRPRQQARLRRLALSWLNESRHCRPAAGAIRFDAIGVIVDTQDRLLRLDHVEGAW
jgi:putative endonuclease